MGTYISHLRNAEILFPKIVDLDAEAFLLGSLAPDSGIPNRNWTRFDPPREVTHWLWPGEGEGQIRDLEFYRRTLLEPQLRPSGIHSERCPALAPQTPSFKEHPFVLYLDAGEKQVPGTWRATTDLLRTPSSRRRYSFLLGYFFHLVCDNLWSLWIVAALERDHRALIEDKGSQAWASFKQDWYDLDRRYVRDHPEARLWQVLAEARDPPRYLPYLPPEATSEQLRYIRDVYVKPDPGRPLDRRYPYLNEASMDRYVSESSAVALEILNREGELATIRGTQTALSLLPAERLQPYEPPLGDA